LRGRTNDNDAVVVKGIDQSGGCLLDRKAAISTLGSADCGRSYSKEKLMRISLAKGISAVVVSIVMVGTSLAGDVIQSGLKVGEPVNAFLVDDITGPNQGTTLCYR
jgi:hypothetical protein